MSNQKTMPLEEFRNAGLLFEINRSLLHPLGLAMAFEVDTETGKVEGVAIIDSRDDPEGFIFSDKAFLDGCEKLETYMRVHGEKAWEERFKALGFKAQIRIIGR